MAPHPSRAVHAVALCAAALVLLCLAPGAGAQFTDNVTGYVSGGDLLSSSQCRVRAVFGECLADGGCAWCDERSVQPARNPTCMSLFETSECALQNKPQLSPRLPEERFPDCEARCESIGLRDPCIGQQGCGWCANTGRCLSGSAFGGPCKECAAGWTLSLSTTCRPGYGGEREAVAGGDCTTCKCQNGGSCSSAGDCTCPANVTGTLCQTPKTRFAACNRHGDWNTVLDKCMCDDGYAGVGDNWCKFECDPVTTCGGKGYCSDLTGECVCDTDAAGKSCQCSATPLTTYPYADPLKNEGVPGCCAFGFEVCPSESSIGGKCVLAPADTNKCPVFKEDNTTLIILVVLALMFGAYLAAAVIAYCITRPRPMCTLVIKLPEVLVLREVLFKRSARDTLPKKFMEIEVPLRHNFWKVKRMICRRLKSQPGPEEIQLVYLGSELMNRWVLRDGIQCADTVHVKLKLRNVEITDYVRQRDKFWNRVKLWYTNDNIIILSYFLGLLVIILCLLRWPGDPDPMSDFAPPPPLAAVPPPPPQVVALLSPPLPPAPPIAPPPPPAAWVAVQLAQQSITLGERYGEYSTLDSINNTLPIYLRAAAAAAAIGNSSYVDAVSFRRTQVGSTLFYITHEDAPLWPDQLPSFVDDKNPPKAFSVIFRTGCFPNLASQYRMSDTGVIEYQPEANAVGQDFMTYYGLIAESVAIARGLVSAGLVDCENKVENLCVTMTYLANIVIESRNDAPIAANGEPTLDFTSPGDYITMNTEPNALVRNNLAAPQRLIRRLLGSDVDGDLLKYTITGAPKHGHAEIIEENNFFYVPEPNFTGSDYFQYIVDDSRSNTAEHTRFDIAYVVVQVGFANGLPQAVPSKYWTLEDNALIGKLTRTPTLFSIVETLSYIVVTPPVSGTVTILCGGRETVDASCTYGPGNAMFRYTPKANFFGEDPFTFGIVSSSFANQTLTNVVDIEVRPVNDVPSLQNLAIDAVMNRGKKIYSFADADIKPLSVIVSDVDDANFTMHLHRIGGPKFPTVAGRFFKKLDAFGRPTDEINMNDASQLGVEVFGGTFQSYYMAPPLAHGLWTEQYAMRARDGALVSNSSTLTINVKCSPGYIAESDAFDNAVTTLGICEACPMGSISTGFDATRCSKCPLGMSSGDSRSGVCQLCPVGTYADIEGLVFCKTCPVGSTSAMGADNINQCYCSVGYYGTPGNCRPCPNLGRWGEIDKWTYCVEDNLQVPLPQPGFYIVQSAKPLVHPVAIRQCFPEVGCPGLEVPSTDPLVDDVAAGDWRADQAQCKAGYTNEGCDTCEDDYFRLNSRCEACPPLWQPVIYGILMWCILIFAVVAPWVISESSSMYIVVVSTMTIITYSQDIAIFGRYYLGWSESENMRALLKWAFLFQLNPEILSLECTQNVDFVQRWRSLMILPGVMGIIVGAILLAYFVFFGGQRALMDDRTERIRRLQKTWVGCMRSCISLGTVMYAGLTVATLDMFVFQKSVTDGRDYLRAAPALRFGVMESSEVWYQLLPGAAFALIVYPFAMIITLISVFHYSSQRWRKLWIRDLVGFATYAYRDELFFFRVIELLRFLCFALIQLVAFNQDKAGGVSQALSAMVIIAISMSLLILRPYKRYRKKLLEFTILFSHGLVLLMSSLSLAPVTTDISQGIKTRFAELVFISILLTYGIILLDVCLSVVEEFHVFQRFQSNSNNFYKRTMHSTYLAFRLEPPEWTNTPEFLAENPTKSFFQPSTVAVLQHMAAKENEMGAEWTKQERCAFARAIQSMLRHRQVEQRLAQRDAPLVTFSKLFRPEVRGALMGAAALEESNHNRGVMAFAEKKLLRIMSTTHRKFYRIVQKKLKTEGKLNPLLEEWLACKCDGLMESDVHLYGDPSTRQLGNFEDQMSESKGPKLGRPASSNWSNGAFISELGNVHTGKSSRSMLSAQNLRVDPTDGSKFARGAGAEDSEVIDLDWEAEQYVAREYDGRVYFCRFEGYFDDLHREWDRLNEAEKKKADEKEELQAAIEGNDVGDDVEGGAILPWHFLDDKEEEEEEYVPEDVDKLGVVIVSRRNKSVKQSTHVHTHTHTELRCCMLTCKPGQICIHGNRMPLGLATGGVVVPPKWQVTVPVRLEDTSQEVKHRVLEEIRNLRDNGAYDGAEGAEPEVLRRKLEELDLVYRAAVVNEPVTVGEARMGWKVDVTLEAKHGAKARTTATLLLRDDLSQMQRDMLELQESKTNVMNRHTTHETTRTIIIGSKQNQTVRDLREEVAELRGYPFGRTILRYRNAQGKEIINDAATLERKKVYTVNDVTVELEREDSFYVYHEVRNHYTFLEAVFRVYASIQTLEDVHGVHHRHTTTALLMSMQQFTRLFQGCDLGSKLNNPHHDGLRSTLEAVFRSVKANENCASQIELLVEQESELAGSLAPSRARRLLQRTRLSDALAFDEFITAVVLLSWLVYGFKVPQSSTRGVARSLRFFVERVMRGNVVEMHTAHDILLQFASARTAEGATPIAAKDALFVYRYFTRDNHEGMSLEQWLELVQWLLAISAETNKYGILLFYTHQGPIKAEPAWVEEGCRRGRVAPIGDEDGMGTLLLKFPRFQVAFSELCYRGEAAEGGTPSARQARAFRRAMQRSDLTQTPPPASDQRILQQYQHGFRAESSTRAIPPGPPSIQEEEDDLDHGEAWAPACGGQRSSRVTRNVVATNNAAADNGAVTSSNVTTRTTNNASTTNNMTTTSTTNNVTTTTSTRDSRASNAAEAAAESDDEDGLDHGEAWAPPMRKLRLSDPAPRTQQEAPRNVAAVSSGKFVRSSTMAAAADVTVDVQDWGTQVNTSARNTGSAATAPRAKLSGLARREEGKETTVTTRTMHDHSSSRQHEETARVKEGSDNDSASEDEQVGSQRWVGQQEQRRSRYRVATTSSSLYDVEAIRRQQAEQERARVEFDEAERNKQMALERTWGAGASRPSRSTAAREALARHGASQSQSLTQSQQAQSTTKTTTTTSSSKQSRSAHQTSGYSREDKGGGGGGGLGRLT